MPRTDPAKGTLRFYADAARYLVDPVPYAVAKYRSAAYRGDASRNCSRRERFDAVVCDFLPPLVNMPATAALPVDPLHAQRRGGDLAAARRDGDQPGRRGTCSAQQWQRMLRFERDALARFDLVLAVSEADGETFERLYPGSLRAPVHVVQTGVDTRLLHAASPTPARRDAPRLHRLDGLAAERRRHALLRPRHPAARPPGRARTRR